MPSGDYFIPVGIGGFFAILGIILIVLGKGEERAYYDSLASHTDAREFLEHWPERPRVGAIKIGGWIALAVGLLMVVMGGAFWLWG
ncbi:unnamed protein product [marine sediment metagenome]|uniref:Uncharacterized protein n=1 Tax=marine sediment metagenome TaxID=412755 RepID=X1QM57_9ZZZZ